MEITVSSRQFKNSSKAFTLFCSIRKEYVKETPEERVRQNTLSSLFLLGYPSSLIAVERKVADVAITTTIKVPIPNRRIDILCYRGSSLEPLLLIECKANSFNNKELRQLLGYNFYIQARYIALVNPQKVHFLDVLTGIEHDHFPNYATVTPL